MASTGGLPPTSIMPEVKEIEIQLSHRLQVGKKDGPAPVINDLDWSCYPSNCKGKGAIAMLACVSSFGTDIFYLPRNTRKWTRMVIKKRPSREGQSLHWHVRGKFLATTSDPKDGKPGNLSILSYDDNFMCFNADKVYECEEGSSITSLKWVSQDQDKLVAAVRPSSEILCFEFNRASGTVSLLSVSKCHGFPLDTPISLESHPVLKYVFSCAPDADRVLVWGYPTDMEEEDNFGLIIKYDVPVELGQRGMEFSKNMNGLFTFQERIWRFWSFSEHSAEMLTCKFTSVDEHRVVIGKKMKYRSHLVSFSASKKRYFAASVGSGDTMIVHKKAKKRVDWQIKGYRNKEVCYRAAKCLKFNPKDDLTMRVAMGGLSGYIHIWAIYKRTSPQLNVIVPDRCNEQSFYKYYLNPKNKDLPSTSSGDEDEAGDVEVVVEAEEEKDVVEDYGDDDEEDDDDEEEDDDDDDDEEDDEDREGELQDLLAGSAAEGGSRDGQGQKKGEGDMVGLAQGIAGLAVQERSGDDQGGKKLIERFDEITTEAQRIADCIETDGTVSSEEMKALCQKILYSRDEIAQAIKREDA